MNKSAFLQLIQQSVSITDQQTEELEKVAATFPYCQTAHLLLAKSAYDKGSMLSTQRLRRASAYATNRQLLKRTIYTSPVAEPSFDENAVEEQHVAVVQEIEEHDTPTTTPEALLKEPAAYTPVPEEVITPNEAEKETVSLVQSAVPEMPEQPQELVAVAVPEGSIPESLELNEEPEEPLVGSMESPEPEADILEQPMEKLNSELALLLTIKSLSPSFTDLLAQKPDAPTQEAPATPAPTVPLAPEPEQDEHEASTETPAAVAPEVPSPQQNHDELAQLIATETAAAAKAYYTLDADAAKEPQPLPAEAPLAETEQEQEAPEVIYAYDEIDQMYQQDTLGYWMCSSRMGEVLQLKDADDTVRPRPQGFHPELILEYSKTHEMVKQEEPAAPSLHHQLDIIDQFLKINPRLKAMNNVKLKPEPQEDLSLKSSKIKRGIASESLANIFLQQGKVKKAIKIYEQLILKYPEKKSYFAEQIEKLQNLS